MGVTRMAYAADGWGEGELWFEGSRLVWHELPRPLPDGPRPARAAAAPPSGARVGPGAQELLERLAAYFGGAAVSFDEVELELGWCTPFQRSVARALRDVLRGQVVTYQELAALAGHPLAQRAVGTFCAHNRFPLVLPCHRVVGASGLGSYGSLGSAYKRRLLELEHAAL